jgi:hypothetical protein
MDKTNPSTQTSPRYVSDGDALYNVRDMVAFLKEPKDALTEVYVFTKYNYEFECAVRDMLAMGLIEQAGEGEYTYPFEGIAATLEDIRNSGVFTAEEVTAMDVRVLALFEDGSPETTVKNELNENQ